MSEGHQTNYVKIWAILLVLLVISFVGPFLGIRVVTLVTAFGIALVKAYLVAKNFMHLDIEKPIIHWLLAIALAFMVLLYSGVAPDVMKGDGANWKKGAGWHTPIGNGHDDYGESRGHGEEVGDGDGAETSKASGHDEEAEDSVESETKSEDGAGVGADGESEGGASNDHE
jgi:caa(3)-type oxidase subunit IV